MKLGQHTSYQKCPFAVFIVMCRNLYPKSSFRSCPYTVLVKFPVRFYSIFDEIGQNVDGKMYFYHKSHCSTTTTESNGSLFSSLAPANGCAQKNCAERFSALKLWARRERSTRGLGCPDDTGHRDVTSCEARDFA